MFTFQASLLTSFRASSTNGRPTEDDRFALIDEVWVADKQFDWFCAWLWSQPRLQFGPQGFMGVDDRVEPLADRVWIEKTTDAADKSGIWAPVTHGGWDPLHLTSHIGELTMPCPGSQTRLVLDRSGGPHGVLIASDLSGWHRHLHEAPELAEPHPSGRSWRIEVLVTSIGSLGTYRRSRDTGRWFAGPHALHMVGNPA